GAYSFDQIYSGADNSEVRCPDPKTSEAMKAEIDAAAASGDTAGGAAEVLIHGVKPGIGAHVQRDRKLEYGLMGELGAIQTVKCVGIGAGVRAAALRGSQIHDGITVADDGTYARTSNNAGGIEGGISNGEDIRIMVYCKPVPTLAAGLPTVNLARKTPVTAAYERSDVCVVPAVGVIAENIAAYVLLNTILETTGGDTLQEVAERYLKK
ncbi:MAG: chorismate synthase, partial [Firmicutes bacterium]|nr:chorismate synthase [Bacillota bacterium]